MPPKPCAGAGTICNVAGTGLAGFDGDGRPATETAFYLPSAARVAADGRVSVMDFNNHRLRRLDKDTVVHTTAGNGVHSVATAGAPATSSGLENPVDFAFAPDGTAVFVSYHDPRVLRVSAAGVIEVVAGTGDLGDAGDGGDALKATFNELVAIAVAPDGAIYVSDDKQQRVRVIRQGKVDNFAGTTGVRDYKGDGGPATQAALAIPLGLAVDGKGRVYIADSSNDVIRRVDDKGVIATVAGNGKEGFDGDGGPATKATLFTPHGVAVAADGTMYIADNGNDRVRKVDPGGVITTFAGCTIGGVTAGSGGDGGPATAAQLHGPNYLHLGPDALYIADQLNNRVRLVFLH